MGDELGDAAAEQGQEKDLAHAGEAVPDRLGKGENGQIAPEDADKAGGENADGQRQEYVHADDGQDQHQHIGEDLDEHKGPGLHDGGIAPADQEQDCQGDEGGGQGDKEVHPELVLQGHPLGPGGGDGGVGDHREVVTEHGAACTGSQHHRYAEAALAGKAHGNGHQGWCPRRCRWRCPERRRSQTHRR